MSKRYNKGRDARRKPNPYDEEYKKNAPKLFEELVKKYFQSSPHAKNVVTNNELEVKFGTIDQKRKYTKPYTKMDYDNVVKKLKSLGFTTNYEEGAYLMRIVYEYLDKETGYYKDSNIRAELNGFRTIQEYCKTNDLNHLVNSPEYATLIDFVKKTPVYENDNKIHDVDYVDFDFRVSYRREEKIASSNIMIRNALNNWMQTKKGFRYINRVTFTHPDLPIKMDLSIVKSSPLETITKDGRDIFVTKKTYTTDEAGVFSAIDAYEIEIEVDNSRLGPTSDYAKVEALITSLRKSIKYVMMGLQGTNYPVSLDEQKKTLIDYMRLLHGKDYDVRKRVYPSNFIGPSSYTLQTENIIPEDSDVVAPNIRRNYVVTDKADGERNLMFISPKGRIYLITTNMQVVFTGSITKEETLFNSLYDGELILHNKNRNFINLFAIFDAYYINGLDVRRLKFMDVDDDDKVLYRYKLMHNTMTLMKPVSILENEISPMRFQNKRFYPETLNPGEPGLQIFSACNHILQNVDNGLYEYETDGLIFTPAYYGVGSDQTDKTGPLKKITWDYSFKWKPPEFNTIDFLVITKKSDGDDIITPVFQPGKSANALDQYKTIELRCGYNQKKHGYLNPCQDVYEDKLPDYGDKDDSFDYKPVLFVPTKPYDPEAGICKILLKRDDTGVLQMFAEDGDVFENNTIVEFKYKMDREKHWRWVPIRVRNDKTTELRQGITMNYGNAYHVAESNWRSIHNPITKETITSGFNISSLEEDEDVYYNRIVKSKKTMGLRAFHNYIKSKLITSVSNKGDTLIDYACGKGGDFSKWTNARLSFVFGIDKSPDNLENRVDGACARYLGFLRTHKNVPASLFVTGDTGKNIRSGEGIRTDKGVQIMRAVFGEGGRDEGRLGRGVVKQYGKAADGFDVSSCQFALHYFFGDLNTLQNFVKNLAECTKLGGYFISTAYDGKSVFNMLKNKEVDEGVSIYEDGSKVWEVKKRYSMNSFENDSSSLAYKIDVFQESINKLQSEYLVNYDYFTQVMEDYGFHPVSRDEAKELSLPSGSGLFSSLYTDLVNKHAKSKDADYRNAINMNEYEKKISFLNRFVVFKKIRIVNTAKVVLAEAEEDPDIILKKQQDVAVEEITEESRKTSTAPTSRKLDKKKPRKLTKKLIIVDENTSSS